MAYRHCGIYLVTGSYNTIQYPIFLFIFCFSGTPENLGITPLAREFAALTIDESAQDSTSDSFRTSLSRMDDSFQSTTSQAEQLDDVNPSPAEDLADSPNQTVLVEGTLLESSSSPEHSPGIRNHSDCLDESVIILHDDADFTTQQRGENRSQFGFRTSIKTEKPDDTLNQTVFTENTSPASPTLGSMTSSEAPNKSCIVLSDDNCDVAAAPHHGEKRSQIGYDDESPKKIKLSHIFLPEGNTGDINAQAAVLPSIDQSFTQAQNFAKQIEQVINTPDSTILCSAFQLSDVSTSLDALKTQQVQVQAKEETPPSCDKPTHLPHAGVDVDLENELVFEMVTPDVRELNESSALQTSAVETENLAENLSGTVAVPKVCPEENMPKTSNTISIAVSDKGATSEEDNTLGPQNETAEKPLENFTVVEGTPVPALSSENVAEQPNNENTQSAVTPSSTTSQEEIQKPTVEETIQNASQKEMFVRRFDETSALQERAFVHTVEEVPITKEAGEESLSAGPTTSTEAEKSAEEVASVAVADSIPTQKDTVDRSYDEATFIPSSTSEVKQAENPSEEGNCCMTSSLKGEAGGVVKALGDNAFTLNQDETPESIADKLDKISLTTPQTMIQEEIEISDEEITPSEVPLVESTPSEVTPVESVGQEKAPLDIPPVESTSSVVTPVESTDQGNASLKIPPVESTPSEVPHVESTPSEVTSVEGTDEKSTPSEVPSAESGGQEKAPLDVSPVESTPSVVTPVESTDQGNAPLEIPPVESGPSEVPPVEGTPSEVPSVENAPSEVPPVESAPLEVTRGESAPSEVTPVESAPLEVTRGESAPPEVTPVESTPLVVTRGESAPSEVPSVESTPSVVPPPSPEEKSVEEVAKIAVSKPQETNENPVETFSQVSVHSATSEEAMPEQSYKGRTPDAEEKGETFFDASNNIGVTPGKTGLQEEVAEISVGSIRSEVNLPSNLLEETEQSGALEKTPDIPAKASFEEIGSKMMQGEVDGKLVGERTAEVEIEETAQVFVDESNETAVVVPPTISHKETERSTTEVVLSSGGVEETTEIIVDGANKTVFGPLTMSREEIIEKKVKESTEVLVDESDEILVSSPTTRTDTPGAETSLEVTHPSTELNKKSFEGIQEIAVVQVQLLNETVTAHSLDLSQAEQSSQYSANTTSAMSHPEALNSPSAVPQKQLIEDPFDGTIESAVAPSTISKEDIIETPVEQIMPGCTRSKEQELLGESVKEATETAATVPSDVLRKEGGESSEDTFQPESSPLVDDSQKEDEGVQKGVNPDDVLKITKDRRSLRAERIKLNRELSDQLPDAPAYTLQRWEELLCSEFDEGMEILENEESGICENFDSYQPLAVMMSALTPIQEVMENSSDSCSSVSPNPVISKELLAADTAVQRLSKSRNLSDTVGLDESNNSDKIAVSEFLYPASVSKIVDSYMKEDESPSLPPQNKETHAVNTSINPAVSGLIDKWLAGSTPLTAFRKQIASMNDVSPISTASPEPFAAHSTPTNDSFCTKSEFDSPMLDQGMLESSPEAQPAATSVNTTQTLIAASLAMVDECLLNETSNMENALIAETTNTLPISHNIKLQCDTSTNENELNYVASPESATKSVSEDNRSNSAQNADLNTTKVLHGDTTSTLYSPLNATQTLPGPTDTDLENFLTHAPMNSTITLVRSNNLTPENPLNQTRTLEKAAETPVASAMNTTRTLEEAAQTPAASAMNTTRTLAKGGNSTSPVMVVSPICSQAPITQQTAIFSTALDENWNGTAPSDHNKNKKMAVGVLKEINDNIQEDNMGAWFSAKENQPMKSFGTEHFGNFDITSINFPPPSTGVINRESLYMRFDPLYQPPDHCSEDKTIFIDNLNTLACLSDKTGDNLEAKVGFQSPDVDSQEKIKKEIARLYALYDEKQQKTELIEADFTRQCANIERQCIEARQALEESETRQEVLQHRLLDLTTTNRSLAVISKEYERTVEAGRADLKTRRKAPHPDPATLAAERDSYQHHLKSAEAAFVDVLTKYEKLRTALSDLQSGVAQQEREAAELRRELTRQDELIRASETAAAAELELLRRETRSEEDQFSTDAARVTAQLRKSELSLKTLQDSLDKTVVENEKLSALCDDIIAGRS